MTRLSPDAGRRRARRRDGGAVADVAPLYATGVLAVATLAFATFAVPASLQSMATTASIDTCHPLGTTLRAQDDTRG